MLKRAADAVAAWLIAQARRDLDSERPIARPSEAA